MRKITFLIILFAFFTNAQDLSLLTGSNLSISEGSQLYINGMELQPNVAYDVVGPNDITAGDMPLSEPQSVGKVIELTNPMNNYTGSLIFYYKDLELNDINEEELTLIMKNGQTNWLVQNSNLNTELKTVNIVFEEPVNISGITASKNQTAGVNNAGSDTFQIYPNPTSSTLQINYPNDIEVQIFDMLGNSMITTTQKSINLSTWSTGTYLIKIIDLTNDTSIVKKIIKN